MDQRYVRRRSLLAGAIAAALFRSAHAGKSGSAPEARWYDVAVEMRRLAESQGDQPYGAVLVLEGAIVGWGPSRVVKDRNPDAHAERVALRDAQRRTGREKLTGAVLVSTSRPCSLCEAAAARAGVARMFYGPLLADAGVPGQPR